uniref:Lipoprotein n=1 Tax=Echinococcus granulosus TaxID=6210 RepID=A0A068WRH8_ECHGR|nr:hypothetical protein EgrG_001192000 [Echinococcus granulosus]
MVDRRQIAPHVFFAIAGGVISCLSSRISPLNDRFGRPDALCVHYRIQGGGRHAHSYRLLCLFPVLSPRRLSCASRKPCGYC